MKITVEYSAFLKHHLGRSSETVETGDAWTVQDLLRDLAARHGEPFRSTLLDANQQLRPMMLLAVDGAQVDWNIPVALRDGNVVTVLSPIAGGAPAEYRE
ncbi:MAG: MoaD/ThiS family protein [bacterium]